MVCLTSLRREEEKGACAGVWTVQVACWKNPGRQRAVEHRVGLHCYFVVLQVLMSPVITKCCCHTLCTIYAYVKEKDREEATCSLSRCFPRGDPISPVSGRHRPVGSLQKGISTKLPSWLEVEELPRQLTLS